MCGIATDYCVQATALDAARNGFTTTVLLDLTAAVAPDQPGRERSTTLAGSGCGDRVTRAGYLTCDVVATFETLAPDVRLPAVATGG